MKKLFIFLFLLLPISVYPMFIMDTGGDTIQAEGSAASSLTISVYGVERASTTNTYKKLGQTQLTGSGTKDTVYTVPASTTTVVSVIVITNVNASSRTINLWHVPNGGSAGDDNAIFDAISISGDGALIWNRGNIKMLPESGTDHGTLTGLTDDDHTQYFLLAGRSGGQTGIGGTGSGDDLTFQTTSNATKGSYIFSEMTSAGFLKNNASGVVTGGNSVDISDDTNLTVTAPITLTDDDIGINVLKDLVTTAPLTGGTDDILPGSDADITLALTVLKDIVAGVGLSGGENDVLPGADADTTLTFDATELDALTWDAGSLASIAWTWNLSAGDPTITFGNDSITTTSTINLDSDSNAFIVGDDQDAGMYWDNAQDDIKFTEDLNIHEADPHLRLDPDSGDSWEMFCNANDRFELLNDTDKVSIWRVESDNNIDILRNTDFSENVIITKDLTVDTPTLYVDSSNDRVGIATTSPTSTLHTAKSFATAQVTKTADYTATESDCVIFVDSSAAAVTITLPTAVGIAGRWYAFNAIDATGGVTIDGAGAETIDGALTLSFCFQYESIIIVSDGANWFTISKEQMPCL